MLHNDWPVFGGQLILESQHHTNGKLAHMLPDCSVIKLNAYKIKSTGACCQDAIRKHGVSNKACPFALFMAMSHCFSRATICNAILRLYSTS